MLVLFETPAGYALFKVLNEKKLKSVDDLWQEFSDADRANQIVKLQAFKGFADSTEAVAANAAFIEGKLPKSLKSFLNKQIVKKEVSDELAVADSKLASVVLKKLNIKCVHDNAVQELIRGIRGQMSNLINGLGDTDLRAIQLGLAHNVSRHKLRFSADKVDTMIVQAINLLDDIDKELNTYAMRVREWFGWHFPEMGKIVTDNIEYAKTVKAMGCRTNCAKTELSTVLDDETEAELREAAQVSMGTEISEEDVLNIQLLCDQVIDLSDYRSQLFEYLQNRMRAVAPNLTTMVGELVGARLIAHAGSLINLAKHPASTVQILGAEKALFRALKTKHETPKYGLIYYASLIGQAAPKHKGKISRVLAAKCALSCRVDALTEGEIPLVGVEMREKVEARLRQLEGTTNAQASGGSSKKAKLAKYDGKEAGGLDRKSKQYSDAADITLDNKKSAKKEEKSEEKSKKRKEPESEAPVAAAAEKKKKKDKHSDEDGEVEKKKKKKEKKEEAAASDSDGEKKKKKKEKKEKKEEAAASDSDGEKKKKKKKKDKKDN